MSWGSEYREYVPVGQRKAQAVRFAVEHAKTLGRPVQPVMIRGNKIAKTFWGKAWCDHLESYSDYANRLPRGRTYVRNGSVADLVISAGRVEAIVAGSDTYQVDVRIDCLKTNEWKKLRSACSTSIDSLLDLLGGRFSDGVMKRLTRRPDGIFPSPKEIKLDCSCPDWAGMCKHVAAVLYGVGARLDERPELLFLLRDVDHTELVSEAVSEGNLSAALGEPSTALAGEDLGAMFGIDLDVSAESSSTPAAEKKRKPKSKKKKAVPGKTSAKKATKKKAVTKKDSSKKVAKKPATKKTVKKKNVAQKSVTKKKAAKKKAVSKTSVKKAAKNKAARRGAAKKKAVKKSGAESK